MAKQRKYETPEQMETEEVSNKGKDYYVTICDSNEDIIYQDDFDLKPDEQCVLNVDVPDGAVFPLKVKTLSKGDRTYGLAYRETDFTTYDNGWVALPKSGSETQETEER